MFSSITLKAWIIEEQDDCSMDNKVVVVGVGFVFPLFINRKLS